MPNGGKKKRTSRSRSPPTISDKKGKLAAEGGEKMKNLSATAKRSAFEPFFTPVSGIGLGVKKGRGEEKRGKPHLSKERQTTFSRSKKDASVGEEAALSARIKLRTAEEKEDAYRRVTPRRKKKGEKKLTFEWGEGPQSRHSSAPKGGGRRENDIVLQGLINEEKTEKAAC